MKIEEKINKATEKINKSNSILVFTGAGISTESGIPDFRSPDGIWSKYDPRLFTFEHFMSGRENRIKQWELFLEIYEVFAAAKPNKAHLACAQLEKAVKLHSIITQNIDGLHARAGNSPEKIIEIHGTAEKIKCIECGLRYDKKYILKQKDKGPQDFRCKKCYGILKPAAILFGESMPVAEMEMAHKSAVNCDLCLCIGSSLTVYPAAYFPKLAKENGAELIIINKDATDADKISSIAIHGKAGETMERITEGLKI